MTERREEKPESPLLVQLVEEAYRRFMANEVFIDPVTNREEGPYISFDAADEAVAESGVDMMELAIGLLKQSNVSFDDFQKESLVVDDYWESGWSGLFRSIAHGIVAIELERQHPEIDQISKDRMNRWDETQP